MLPASRVDRAPIDLAALYDHYAPPVYTLALRLLGTLTHADAVLLDVLTEWVPRLTFACPLPPAFPVLAVPTYTTAVAYRTRVPLHTDPRSTPLGGASDALPLDIARIHRLLSILTPEQRDCLILWTSTIPLPIIAGCLGCPTISVRAHLQAGIHALRVAYGPAVLRELARDDPRDPGVPPASAGV